MKFLQSTKALFTFLLILVSLIPFASFAQEPEDPCTDPLDPCPIDNGVLLLVAGAVAIAIKKTVVYKRN